MRPLGGMGEKGRKFRHKTVTCHPCVAALHVNRSQSNLVSRQRNNEGLRQQRFQVFNGFSTGQTEKRMFPSI